MCPMPAEDLRWYTLSDFSPGIRHKLGLVGQGSAQCPVPSQGHPSHALTGIAAQQGTYRCIALPTGGLGPLPRRVYSYSRDHWFADRIGPTYVSGFHVAGPVIKDTQYACELWIAYETCWTNLGAKQRGWR